MKEDDLQEILTIFKSESEEHLQKLNEGILALEKDPGKMDIIEEVFREAHSLKGAARMIGFEEIEKIAHAIEDIFNDARKGKLVLKEGLSDFILEGLDLINSVVDLKLRGKGEGEVDIEKYLMRHTEIIHEIELTGEVQKAPAGKKPPSAKPPSRKNKAVKDKVVSKESDQPEGDISVILGAKEKVTQVSREAEEKASEREKEPEPVRASQKYEETIRVSIEKLDELMAQVGEILVAKIRSDQRLQEIRAFLVNFTLFQRNWHRHVRHMISRPHLREGRQDDLSEFIIISSRLVDDLMDQLVNLSDGMAEENLRLELISRDIQESVNQIRMLPMSAIFNYFPRLVRDMAREQCKEMDLVIHGAETRLDKRILEELKDPLTQLLRNSIDHGLETPEEREASGKDRIGKLTLTAYQKGSNVLVELSDDGRGIDTQKIKEVALKRGFASEETLSEMKPSQLFQIIFQPGFTTKSIITDVSGRGVGLDVVMTNIERLKGSLSTTSSLGKGTKFSIKLPLTLATIQALLIKTSHQRFAIPMTAVEYTGEIDMEEINTVEGKETVLINDQPIGIIRLSEVLEMQDTGSVESEQRVSLVVLSSSDDRVAFVVDGFIGEKEVVVKNLGAFMLKVPNVAGATLLADGTPVIILNVFDLIKNAQKAQGAWVVEKMMQHRAKQEKHTVMVVDDSITTRTLEKNILESSGYNVVTAVDGLEALNKLKTKKVDLIVSDIQMPKMDGFTLSQTLKMDKNYSDIPIILVTSLESEEDKKKGIEVGAEAYITKGAFDQGNLLNTIKQLL